MSKLSKKRLVNELMDAYVGWREACLRVSDAYGSWARDTGVSATCAFGRYMAALDREERAAEDYAGLVQRAGQLAWSSHAPAVIQTHPAGDTHARNGSDHRSR